MLRTMNGYPYPSDLAIIMSMDFPISYLPFPTILPNLPEGYLALRAGHKYAYSKMSLVERVSLDVMGSLEEVFK